MRLQSIFLTLVLAFLTIGAAAQETKIHPAQILSAGATDGQVLTYNAATDEYEPVDLAAGGLTAVATDATLTGDGTAGSPISVNASSLPDNSATNELQTLVGSGANNPTLDLTNSPGGPVTFTGTGATNVTRSGAIYTFNSTDDQILTRSNNKEVTIEGGTPTNIVVGKTRFVNTPTSGNTVTLTTAIDLAYLSYLEITRGLPQKFATSGTDKDVTISPDGLTLTFNHRGFDGDNSQEVEVIYIAQ